MLPDPQSVPHLMLQVVSVAELVGLVDPLAERSRAIDTFAAPTQRLQQPGVGRHAPVAMAHGSPYDMGFVAAQMLEAIDGSPMPALEWPALLPTLGEELLADLVAVSLTSVRRYASGARRTPDDVADRLHTVALVVASLQGSYNDLGVRRWFHRPRTALSGKAPADVLAGDWSSDDPEVVAVRSLADSLLGAAAG